MQEYFNNYQRLLNMFSEIETINDAKQCRESAKRQLFDLDAEFDFVRLGKDLVNNLKRLIDERIEEMEKTTSIGLEIKNKESEVE